MQLKPRYDGNEDELSHTEIRVALNGHRSPPRTHIDGETIREIDADEVQFHDSGEHEPAHITFRFEEDENE